MESEAGYRKIYSTVFVLGLAPLALIAAAMMVTSRAPGGFCLLLVLPAAVFVGLWTFLFKLRILPVMISSLRIRRDRRKLAHGRGPAA